MARRKKRKTKYVTKRIVKRSRGMGAVDFTGLLYSAVGGIGARLLNRVLPTTLDPKIISGIQIGAGVVMPMLSKDAKTKKMLGEIGMGMVGVGATDLVMSFGFMTGVGAYRPSNVEELALVLDSKDGIGADVLGADVLGENDINVVNGYDIPVMNGYGNEDDDFAMEMEDSLLD
jgi:hypothetical protein